MKYDPYEQLANAIVIQAVKDYREDRRTLRKRKSKKKLKEARARIREVMIFFKSDYFTQLTTIDTYELIERLKAEFK